MKSILYTLSLLSFVLFSCQSNHTKIDPEHSTRVDSSSAKTTQTVANGDASWEGFWLLFQEAVASGEKAQVADLTAYSKDFSQDKFNEYYEYAFTNALRKLIAKTQAQEVGMARGEVQGEDVHVLTLSEVTQTESGDMESATMLFFGKINGHYRLIKIELAG